MSRLPLWREFSRLQCIVLALLTLAVSQVFGDNDEQLTAEAQQIAFFETHVRPILVQHCYECHNSPDDAQGGLAVDWKSGLLAGGDSGPAIVPRDPDASLLLQVVRHEIDGLEMPDGADPLNSTEIAALESWIRNGAADPRRTEPKDAGAAQEASWELKFAERKKWWSLQPIARPVIPDAVVGAGPHPVDRFIHQQAITHIGQTQSREAADGVFAAMADAPTVLRRLQYVLVGLPASSLERETFLADWDSSGPKRAVELAIDRLLASPQFGERWARHWMDWFRYSEGHGSQGDFPIPNAFEYRDYLIRALNDDVPYDRLIREHVAGDLLETPRVNEAEGIIESWIGPAQLRMVEHGYFPVDSLDELVKFTDNQIDVVSKATLGLTVSCARCHDHKFDAISQRDYYALFGVFASSRPSAIPINAPEPLERRRETLEQLRANFTQQLTIQWLTEATPEDVHDRLTEWSSRRTALEAKRAEEIEQKVPANKRTVVRTVTRSSMMYPWLKLRERLQAADQWQQLRDEIIETDRDARQHNEAVTVSKTNFTKRLPTGWSSIVGNAEVVSAGTLALGQTDKVAVESVLPAGLYSASATSREEAAMRSADFTVANSATAIRASGAGQSWIRLAPNGFPMSGAGIYRQEIIPTDGHEAWHHWDTSFWEGELGFIHAMTAHTKPGRHSPPKSVKRPGKPIDGSWWHLAEVRQLKSTSDRIRDQDFAALALIATDASPANPEELSALYASTIQREVRALQDGELSDVGARFLTGCLDAGLLSRDVAELAEPPRAAFAHYRAVERELPRTRFVACVMDTHGFDQTLLVRGNHEQPTDLVPRRFLSALDSELFGVEERSGRLELAEKLTAANNPLFARVIANRLWHYVFGAGLVKTTDNFGHTGQLPSHPELLDHLANHFRDHDWSLKQSLRYMLTSDTFRRSSVPSKFAKQYDPSNRLLTHFNVRRMEGEIIRDTLLAASDQLDPKLFGPSLHARADTRRRTIYLKVNRSLQGPLLSVFDVPMPTTTRGVRDVSTTPAQAIAMLNSPFVRTQAERWAADHIDQPAEKSLSELFSSAFTRSPTTAELDALVAFVENGEEDRKTALRDAAHLVFNFKEFLFVR